MIPNEILRAVSARMREIDNLEGPKLADLTDLHPISDRDAQAIDVIAYEVRWLKNSITWGQL